MPADSDPIIRTTFDDYAATYDAKFNANPIARYQRECVQALLRPYLSRAQTVLDVGCGPGSDFAFYRQFDVQVTAIDISTEMVDAAKKRANSLALNADIRQSSLLDFSSDAKFDVIVLNFGVINAMPDLSANLNQISDLLQPTGRAIIVSMPPFHLASAVHLLLRGQFRSLHHRLYRHQAILSNGFVIHYYRKTDFRPHFEIEKQRAAAFLLTNPDQYRTNPFFKAIIGKFIKIEQKIWRFWPDILGGDHMAYVLKRFDEKHDESASDVH